MNRARSLPDLPMAFDDNLPNGASSLDDDPARSIVGLSLGRQHSTLPTLTTPAEHERSASADNLSSGTRTALCVSPNNASGCTVAPLSPVEHDSGDNGLSSWCPAEHSAPAHFGDATILASTTFVDERIAKATIPPELAATRDDGPVSDESYEVDVSAYDKGLGAGPSLDRPLSTPSVISGVNVSGRRVEIKSIEAGHRPRSSNVAVLDGWQKSLTSSIESLPRALAFAAPFSFRRGSDVTLESSSITDGRAPENGFQDFWKKLTTADTATSSPDRQTQDLPRPIRAKRPGAGPSRLGQSASDESLQLRRVVSRTSTLGDDRRFEHVREMINSRSKAIKDSLQDSNIKLPSLPSMSLQSLRSDFSSSRLSLSLGRTANSVVSGAAGRPASTVDNATNRASEPIFGYSSLENTRTEAAPARKAILPHPHFAKACARLVGDVVILGGYRGSVLRSAEPPHRQLWVPVKVGLNIRKVNLEVGLNVPEDDLAMPSKIFADGMLSNIGPVDISKRLFHRLRTSDNVKSGKSRVHDYGYDWRLDPLLLSEQLIKFLESLACNQAAVPRCNRGATVIAHSLGGLITRHAVNRRPELFAGVVYAGAPADCVNVLGPLRNGDDVLLSSRVLTAQVNFSIRTSFVLLPLSGHCFFNPQTKERYPVDFFDAQTWIDHALSPCVSRADPVVAVDESVTSLLSSLTSAIAARRQSISSAMRSPLLAAGSGAHAHQATSSIHPLRPGDALKPTTSPNAPAASVATHVTISHDSALAYLTTALARVKTFKLALAHDPTLQAANLYPPHSVIFGKNTPTVYGARVASRAAIRRADAFDNLAFASGDGVVLARAAMLPDGYRAAKGGVVSSERGHVSLLGDLEAVGRALLAIMGERRNGTGFGAGEVEI